MTGAALCRPEEASGAGNRLGVNGGGRSRRGGALGENGTVAAGFSWLSARMGRNGGSGECSARACSVPPGRGCSEVGQRKRCGAGQAERRPVRTRRARKARRRRRRLAEGT